MDETIANEVQEAKQNGENSAHKLLLVVFRLGGEEYALPIDQIKEVVLTPKISRIPQTPHYIKGVANIRGNVISIVDLEERFGLASEFETKDRTDEQGEVENEGNSNYTLVIDSEEFKIGVLVKDVPNTLSVFTNEIDNSSGLLKHSSLDENAINGIVKINDRMIIMIDILSMMDTGDIAIAN